MGRGLNRPEAWAVAAILISTLGSIAWAGEPEPRRFEFRETHMGSEFRILLYSHDEGLASRASRRAFNRIASLDNALSDYKPDSELMKLCDQAGGPPVRVSDDLFAALSRSKEMANRSGGAFDATIQPVVKLWRRARRERKLPDSKLLQEALGLVGSDLMVLDPVAQTVELKKRGMRLDLGGIAKGMASQAAFDALKQEGLKQALVGGAGDIVVGDAPPGERGWRVGIAPQDDPEQPPTLFLILQNAAVSTSGDAERYLEVEGVRYSHIVDPRTGVGLTRLSSVTVVADDGATADALATAASVLGPEGGTRLVEESPGAACLFVVAEEKGRRVLESSRFQTIWKEGRTESAPAGSPCGVNVSGCKGGASD